LIQEQAEILALADDPEALLLFAADPDFNSGVIGLAASRLTDKYYRPAIVAHIGSHFTRGSCRSIEEFDITDALDQCVDLLERHGGHKGAAGFTVRNDNLIELVQRLKSIAFDQLSCLDLRPTLSADVEVSLSDLKPEILKYLDWLQPTGIDNREVTFVSRGLQIKQARQVGNEGVHLKLSVSDGWITYDAIAFQHGHWFQHLPSQIDMMYFFEKNVFNGRENIQLRVRDLKPAGTPDDFNQQSDT
jgi:single-stranded-DNA-specific exonuclease